jgi:hypothetical protein
MQTRQIPKLTQFQQVIEAAKSIGGKGKATDIHNEILKRYGKWGTQTMLASVSMYLSRSDLFKNNDDGVWVYQEPLKQDIDQTILKKTKTKPHNRGLYFLTLSYNIKPIGAGFLFKIGKSHDADNRLIAYSASLPIETIRVISFYPIPDKVDLSLAEKQVRGELLGNENLGEDTLKRKIVFQPYFGNHQKEWLQTLDIDMSSNSDELTKVARIINGVVKTTIEALSPKENGDDSTD